MTASPPSQSSAPKRPKVRVAIVVLVVIAVLAGAVAYSPLGSAVRGGVQALWKHHNLKTRSDARELGKLMVSMLRDPEFKQTERLSGDDPRLPERLRDLHPVSLELRHERGSAYLRFGGGFYGFGYLILPEGEQVWGQYHMYCSGEPPDSVELGVITAD